MERIGWNPQLSSLGLFKDFVFEILHNDIIWNDLSWGGHGYFLKLQNELTYLHYTYSCY